MPGFRSAELKAAAEELWVAGIDISARTLGRLFRLGLLGDLVAQVREYLKQRDHLTLYLAQLQKEFVEMDPRIAFWQGQIHTLQQEIATTQRTLQNLARDITHLQSLIPTLESMIHALRSQRDALNARRLQILAELQELGTRLRRLRECTPEYHQTAQLIAAKRAEYDRLIQEIQWLDMDIADYQAQLIQALARLATARAKYTEESQKLQSLQSMLAAAQQTLQSLQERLAWLKQEIARVKKALEELKPPAVPRP